jgi:hypothetical protein
MLLAIIVGIAFLIVEIIAWVVLLSYICVIISRPLHSKHYSIFWVFKPPIRVAIVPVKSSIARIFCTPLKSLFVVVVRYYNNTSPVTLAFFFSIPILQDLIP